MPPTPVPVWVRLALVLPPNRVGSGNVPLRVRMSGIDVAPEVPGDLLSWHQTLTGDWWAMCRFSVTNRTERASLMVTQFVSTAAVRPRTADGD